MGRHKLENPEDSKAKPQRSCRANDAEWELMKRVKKLAKTDYDGIKAVIDIYEMKLKK